MYRVAQTTKLSDSCLVGKLIRIFTILCLTSLDWFRGLRSQNGATKSRSCTWKFQLYIFGPSFVFIDPIVFLIGELLLEQTPFLFTLPIRALFFFLSWKYIFHENMITLTKYIIELCFHCLKRGAKKMHKTNIDKIHNRIMFLLCNVNWI